MRPISIGVFVVSTLFSSLAMAQSVPAGPIRAFNLGTVIDHVACNASPGVRQFTLPRGGAVGWSLASFHIDLVHSTATDFNMFCETSKNDQATWGSLQSCDVTAGIGTCNDLILKHPLNSDSTFHFRFDISSSTDLRCIWGCNAGGASDFVTIIGRVSAQ